MSKYSIEARQLNIGYGAAGHMFWVLRDEKGKAVAEMHGLATDRDTGKAIPIGTDPDKHSLRGHHYVHDANYARNVGVKSTNYTYIQSGQAAETIYTGEKSDVLARWKAGQEGLKAINRRDLDYPFGGVDINSKGQTVNSNSVYTTIGEIMIDKAPRISYSVLPGLGNHALTEIQLEQLRYSSRGRGQASNPENGESVVTAANPSGVARIEQAMEALKNPVNPPPGGIPQEHVARIATNMAIYSNDPSLIGDQRSSTQAALGRIESLGFSTDHRTAFITDSSDLRNSISPNIVAVPMEKLLEQPQPQQVQRLQNAQTVAQLQADPSQQSDVQKTAALRA